MSDFCTTDDIPSAQPGINTHDLTTQQATEQFGCCQFFVCGIPCPKQFEDQSQVALQWGLPVMLAAGAFITFGVVVGLFFVKGDAKAYFVCRRSLPLWIVSFALLAQGLDSNATLGAVTGAYKFAYWDGAVLPLGLGLSLLLNGLTLAAKINRMHLLTLPDLYKRKYGTFMEVMVSLIELASFTCLLAGNMVGMALIINFCFGLPQWAGIIIAGAMDASYVMVGGLFSIALTDLPQAIGGFTAFIVVTVYALVTHPGEDAAPPSLGYELPLGNGTVAYTPGYAGAPGCVDPTTNQSTCDNYAYPVGDQEVYSNGMTDTNAYAPFPNAILINWATIFVLGFGNLCALDFQQRSMASKTPSVARWGNIIAGCILLALCLPFTLLAGLVRQYVGPDSGWADFTADTCSAPLGLPSCAQWNPLGRSAFFIWMWDYLPRVLGAWTMVAIVAASMSTATGAILATSTVMANNIWRKIPRIGTNERNLLIITRLFALPMTALACLIAAFSYNPGYLLVVAFDIVFAGCFVPLMAAVYWPSMTPNAGIISCFLGSLLRLILEFTLPKDGSLVAFGDYALTYGPAVPGIPVFMEVDPPQYTSEFVWNPEEEVCVQEQLRDWTGLDSLISPVFCAVVMVTVWLIERAKPEWDLLWYIPKAWRHSTPLYPET